MKPEDYLKIAIEEAKKSSWPFGAVVVCNGEIVSQAGSGDGLDNDIDPTAHAEVNTIRRACNKLNTGDLSNCVLYASCEPCALCIGAIWYSGIKKVIYGTSLDDIKHLSNKWGGDLAFPKNELSETGISIKGGILKDEVIEMFEKHTKVK